MWLEEQVQREIDAAKLEGLEATRKAINSWNHNEEYQWNFLQASPYTTNKLLQGEFKTFEEFEHSSYQDVDADYINYIHILYRRISNKNEENHNNYVIETIFIDE